MLVRDDIILTSYECSKQTFAFDFPDESVGSLRAAPLDLKDDEVELMHPRLGFLKANPPKHYHFVGGRPVMRTRMFLSLQPFPGEDAAAAIMTCDAEGRPVAHNFPVDGSLVPLGHLAKVLPPDILWKERDAMTAPLLKDKSGRNRWWTRGTTLEREENIFKKLLKSYTGPPGSLSIPVAHKKGIVDKVGGLCEAVDPRGHRRQDCFGNYYFRWKHADPFSGMHFFDWLDYGHGADLMERNDTAALIFHKTSDLKCFRETFDKKKVHYFDDDERREHEVYLTPSKDGRSVVVRYRATDEVVPPSPEDESHLYMWGLDGKFYVVDDTWDWETYGSIKHTAVLAGGPALSAGKCFVGKHGRLLGINWSSGHYRPGIPSPAMMHQWMKDKGLNVTSLHWIGRTKWTTETCKKYDWESVQVPGYNNATLLNESCQEVTTSSAWMRKEDDR